MSKKKAAPSVPEIKSIPGLKNYYAGCSEEVQWYFEHVPKLLDDFPNMEVCLAYAFSQLEVGYVMALYVGAVRVHNVDTELARRAVEIEHISTEDWPRIYRAIFGFGPPRATGKDMEEARKTRNLILHGRAKVLSRTEINKRVRQAIACVLHCADEINDQLEDKFQLKPFGNLAGFAGPPPRLKVGTSKLVLRGMGFKSMRVE